jgi:hypothetical protein
VSAILVAPVVASNAIVIPETNNLFESGVADETIGYNPNDPDQALPVSMKLYQNYPNPFNPSTSISFNLFQTSNVTVKVFNVLGQEVATLFNGDEMSAGLQTYTFDASRLTSGVYFYTVSGVDVETGAAIPASIGKMMLLK